jgi:alcohol dehydrogenase
MVAAAAGARVVGVDVAPDALRLARQVGAEAVVDASSTSDVAGAVRDATSGGAHLSLDAVGSEGSCASSILSLRKRGRHVQVGLLPAILGRPRVPMDAVIARELQIIGSHGMPAHAYDEMLALVTAGRVQPELLVTRQLALDELADALVAMGEPGRPPGLTVLVQKA